MSSNLFIAIYSSNQNITQSLLELLRGNRYKLSLIKSVTDLLNFVKEKKEQIDCLIVTNEPDLLPIFNQLYEQSTLLPVVIIDFEEGKTKTGQESREQIPTYCYHGAEIQLKSTNVTEIIPYIDQAIAKFLCLAPSSKIKQNDQDNYQEENLPPNYSFLLLQQRRLAEKLKERLGYLGVYYKRNPSLFYRNLPEAEKQKLINYLNQEYRKIILSYFTDDKVTNQLIDEFVNQAFFADISVSRVLEIHMTLMDEFAQQLKLEGRNEEILLDYRLALIDLIAHLCEMYRRSIPREELPFD